MPMIQVVFTELDNPIIDQAIVTITKGQRFAGHVAIAFPHENYYGPFLIEATPPKLFIQPIDYYDNETNKLVLNIEVTDEQYVAAIERAMLYYSRGLRYGYADCFAGGIASLFEPAAGEKVAELLGCGENEMDCSELALRVLHAPFPDLMGDVRPDIVVPERLWEELINSQETGEIKISGLIYGRSK